MGLLVSGDTPVLSAIRMKYLGDTQPSMRRCRMTEAKTILIVEDNTLNMKLFSDLLQSHGYETLQSTDGMDALSLARKHSPDLIIMDIQLPDVSGIDHAKALKADNDLKNIPVIAVTAHAMKGDDRKMLAAGCDDYIAKPISVPDFLETVAKHIA